MMVRDGTALLGVLLATAGAVGAGWEFRRAGVAEGLPKPNDAREGGLVPRLELSIHPNHDQWLKAVDGRTSAHSFGVATSPNGRAVAVASTDGAVRVWDGITGRLLYTLAGKGDEVWAVAYAPDGRTLAAGERGGVVRLWDPETGGVIKAIDAKSAGDGRVHPAGLAFAPDARWLATSLRRNRSEGGPMWGEVVLLDVKSGTRTRGLSPEKSHMGGSSVCFTPGGRAVGFVARGVASFVEPENGREVAAFVAQEGRGVAGTLAVSPDGKTVAAQVLWSSRGGNGVPDRQEVVVWDYATRERVAALSGHTDSIIALTFLPESATLVSASWDGTIRFWDARKGTERLVIPARPGPEPRLQLSDDGMIRINAAAVSANGAVLAAAYDDGVVRVWDVKALLAAADKK